MLMLSALLGLAIAGYLFWGLDQTIWQYALGRRFPQLLAFVITGGMIATATILFQTITANRILTPSVLGLDALYVCIQTFLVLLGTSFRIVTPNATVNFVLSIGLMILFAFILYKALFSYKQDMYLILLGGSIVGTLFRSLASFMQMILDPNEFALLQGKLFASFNNIQTNLLIIAIIIVLLSLPFIYDYFEAFDVLLLGREQSTGLGIQYAAHTKRIFLIVVVFTAVSTALVGPITFLGLIVANLSYEFTKTYKHQYLILCGTLLGILFLVGGQFMIERVFRMGVPLTVFINFTGGIYFIYLLLKERAK